jgi:flagellar biosynthesis protein FlgN
MTAPFDAAALERTLSAESAAVREFIALLRDEQQSLVRGELEHLPASAEAKANCLFELTRLGEQRLQWLRQHGMPADRRGMESLLDKHAAQSTRITAGWRQLLELAQTAQQINGVNGTLIAVRLNGAQRALNVLFSAANLVGAYAPDGRAVCLRTAHQLAVA